MPATLQKFFFTVLVVQKEELKLLLYVLFTGLFHLLSSVFIFIDIL